MKISRLLLSFAVFTAVQGFGQTVTSVSDGTLNNPSTWDCSCVPGASNDVIVNHDIASTVSVALTSLTINSGGELTHNASSSLGISGDLTVNASGVLITNSYTHVSGNAVINGIWGGSATLDLRGSGTSLSGTGELNNTSTLSFSGGAQSVLAGTILRKALGVINLKNTVLDNYGDITVSVLSNTGASRWKNKVNSRIEIISVVSSSLRLSAKETGNTVVLGREGADQNIWNSYLNTFYNLELKSNGFKKILHDDIIINGDLVLDDCIFETMGGASQNDIEIAGNWINTGGELRPRTGTVNFLNSDDITIAHDGVEYFHNLNLNGTGSVTIAGDLTLTGALINGTDLIMEVSSPRTLEIEGDFTNTGTFTANGSNVTMNGSSAQVLDGEFAFFDLTIDNAGAGVAMATGNHSVSGTLELNNGELNTDDRLTMISDATGDSRIAAITGGSIVGDLTAQRYIDAGATNWRFLTSPTQNNSIGDWTDDFSTSGFTGSTWPTFSFTSVYFHDETAPGTIDDGFVAATDISDAIAPGQGIWVWSGDNMAGTAPFTVDVTGEIYTGDVNLPVSYTDYGSLADDGWCMVANPYVSVIDWDSPNWNKVDIDDAIYIWVPELEQFASYVGGVSVNGGSRYIASSQAFWVHATSASSQLTATENVKTEQAVAFKNATQDDMLRIALNKNGLKDEMVIRYISNATPNFDAGYDAHEKLSATDIAPNFHSVDAEGSHLMINSFAPATADTTIQLHFDIQNSGNYTISFDELSGRFGRSCLVLEDLVTGDQIAVSEGASHSVSLSAGQNQNRFRLVIAGGIEYFEVSPSCPGASDGMIVANATGAGPHDFVWTDKNNVVIRTAQNVFGNDTLKDIAAGDYGISVQMPSPCGVVSVTPLVLDPVTITSNEMVTASSCNGHDNGTIELNISGGSAPYTVNWTSGETSTMLMDLASGDYTVNITDANGCSVNETIFVPAQTPVVSSFSAPSSVEVGQQVIFQSNSVAAVTAEWDMGDGNMYTSTTPPVHTYSQPGTYTVSLTVHNGSCSNTSTQDIEVTSIATGINDAALNAQVPVSFVVTGGQLYVINNGSQPRSLNIIVSNLVGQQVIAPISGMFEQGPTAIDLQGNRNAIVVINAFDVNSGERWGKRIFF